MIDDVRFDDFIGIFDTKFNTQPLIDYYSNLKLLEKVDGTMEIIQVNQRINSILEAV